MFCVFAFITNINFLHLIVSLGKKNWGTNHFQEKLNLNLTMSFKYRWRYIVFKFFIFMTIYSMEILNNCTAFVEIPLCLNHFQEKINLYLTYCMILKYHSNTGDITKFLNCSFLWLRTVGIFKTVERTFFVTLATFCLRFCNILKFRHLKDVCGLKNCSYHRHL